MTTGEIKEAMRTQGISMKEMADELGVSYDSLRQILAGQRSMTLQLERHITRVLGEAKTQLIMVTVDLPEATARLWTPGWSKLNVQEQQKAATAAAQAIVEQLIEKGAQGLGEEDLAALKALNLPGGELPTVGGGEPDGMPRDAYPAPLDSMA